MGVSKEDRKGYEDGRKEAEYIREHPIGYLLTGGIRSRPSDTSKAEAYDKGLRGEQLDEDKKGNSGCFLTTACVEHAGLSDDCTELQTMRKFRDGYIHFLPDGDSLVEEYYQIAPLMVQRIKSRSDADAAFERLLRTIRGVVELIQAGRNSEAMLICKKEFQMLRHKYGV